MSSALESRLQVLEENYEYQDQLLETLNEVIIKQQEQVDSMQDEIKRLRDALVALLSGEEKGKEPLPPHY